MTNSSMTFLEFTKIIIATGVANSYMDHLELVDLSGGCNTSLPKYPLKVSGATGLFIDNKIVICGGGRYTSKWYTNKCYHLKHGNDAFQLVYSMTKNRREAKSILFHGNMLVIGGDNDIGNLDTGEFINHQLDNSSVPKPGIKLPVPMAFHSFIKINETTAFLVGGDTDTEPWSKETYYLQLDNDSKGIWKKGPELKYGRHGHTTGVLFDHVTKTSIVAVVGGWSTDSPRSLFMLNC